MMNFAEFTTSNNGFGQLNRRQKTIVKAYRVLNSSFLCRFQHLTAICQIQREGLLAKNVLPRSDCRKRDLFMRIGGSVDIDNIDIIATDYAYANRSRSLPSRIW